MKHTVTKQTFVPIGIAIYYLFVGIYMRNIGATHSEALLVSQQIRMWFDSSANFVEIAQSDQSACMFYLSMIFSWVNPAYAPIITSCLSIALLLYIILRDIREYTVNKKFLYSILPVLFAFHPGLVFIAVSGTNNSVVLLLFYLFYRNIFRYFNTHITYFLSLAGIALTAMLFCDVRFIWLAFSFFPFMIAISLEMSKKQKETSFFRRYCEAVSHKSLRRKLLRRASALTILLLLLPLGIFFLYQVLNVERGVTAYTNLFEGNIDPGESNSFSLNTSVFTGLCFLTLSLNRANNYVFKMICTLSIAVFILIAIKRANTNLPPAYNFFFLLLAILFLAQDDLKTGFTNFSRIIISTGLLLCIAIESINIVYNSEFEQKKYLTALLHPFKQISEEERWATYLTQIEREGDNILLDDISAYKIVINLASLKKIILRSSPDFITAAEDPINFCRYVLLTKMKTTNTYASIFNEVYLKKIQQYYSRKFLIVYETEHWRLIKLKP